MKLLAALSDSCTRDPPTLAQRASSSFSYRFFCTSTTATSATKSRLSGRVAHLHPKCGCLRVK
ncbi:hypothetical protein E2C01_074353 [Portunus trituberculatus]|uniref:Uncharacterized protein n=1 Tax=Portunus trituberculatus TaxID=210409 RepID=A0A5B7IE31_PORTR|nr:hypothetical protein [Portunus trituberculatus]